MPSRSIGYPAPITEPLSPLPQYENDKMELAAEAFRTAMKSRRTVRDFSQRSVPHRVIESCLGAAHSAPSGANLQPWHFAVVGDGELKRKIRIAAEEEERIFYHERASEEWLEALRPLGTSWKKPFLEVAPWLIAVFGARYSTLANGRKLKNYYVPESICLASGFLLCALHHAGLATLTHTPSPMGFLNDILSRPANEKPYLLIVVGHPTDTCRVPTVTYKQLSMVTSWF